MRWYPSKIDWWIALLLVLGPAVCALTARTVWVSVPGHAALVALAPLAIMAVIYATLVFPIRYGIDDTTLVVRFGVVRLRIPLADITEVMPTRNPLSSPAMSLDRLSIRYRDKRVMISPADKAGFLDELARRARLRRDRDGLVR